MPRLLVACLQLIIMPALGQIPLLAEDRPNVLIAISDDQSFPHASAYGEPVIKTPGFDEVARRGMLFRNAFTPAPGCSPMRAALLTGQYIWQIREAGTHASHFPRDLATFPERLSRAGYTIGYTGKAWGPGKWDISGWDRNPAGPAYSTLKNNAPKGISRTDYYSNFAAFLDERKNNKPFCFWFGGHEPHRSFGKGLGLEAGMDPGQVRVPSFLPDTPEIRSDLLDYFNEIQWFDQHLLRMVRELQARDMLENTLIIVTSDNGMAFPRAKANLYEYGIHMPLTISWPKRYPGNQTSEELVNLIDVTATIYDACDVDLPESLTGQSLDDLLRGEPTRERLATFSGRERHSSSRWNSLGYPCRCVRTQQFLYIRNYTPQRWPAGTPQKYAKVTYDQNLNPIRPVMDREHGGYHDIDACPSLSYMIAHRNEETVSRLFHLAVDKRPAEEFFDIQADPGCLDSLVDSASHKQELDRHRQMLTEELTRTNDLREVDFVKSHVWETYPRYSSLRWFPKPEWANDAQMSVPRQEWLENRRPRSNDAK